MATKKIAIDSGNFYQMSSARRVIAISALLVLTLGILGNAEKSIKGKRPVLPTPRFLVALGVTFTVISAINDFGQPGFAKGFAYLVVLTAFLTEGADVFTWVIGRAGVNKAPNFKTVKGVKLPALKQGRLLPPQVGKRQLQQLRKQFGH